MLNFNSFMIGSENPESLTSFYEKVFDKKADEMFGWQIGNTNFTIIEHSEVKGPAKEPQRIIFNLETDDVKGEFDRIKSLGAEVIEEPYTMEDYPDFWIATFADPDGNYFQLMSPWNRDNSTKNGHSQP